MDRGLKERLVGAAVLVALAVIFIPMLLDDSPSGPGPITGTNIPDKPDNQEAFSSRIIPVVPEPITVEPPPPLEQEVVPEPAGPDIESESSGTETVPDTPSTAAGSEQSATESVPAESEEQPAAENQAAAENQPAPSETSEKPASSADQPSGWVVQLGSFSQEDNAGDLTDKLQQAGYAAFVEPVEQAGKRVYRVRVGPEVMRSEAEKVREAIAGEFDQLKGIVVSYP